MVSWFGADTAEAKVDENPLPYVSINGWYSGSSRVANKIERQEGSELQQQRRLVKGCRFFEKHDEKNEGQASRICTNIVIS